MALGSAEALTAEDVIDPVRYAREGYPHQAWRLLRREAPIRWFDMGDRPGFWAVTRRADLVELSKQPSLFQIGPRQAVFADSPPPSERPEPGPLVRNLLNMDPPEHALFRKAASAWFTPRAIESRRPEIERLCGELLDEMAGDGEETVADFVQWLAAPLTLSVLADMLGVPRSDWELMFRWTNEFAGAGDPEFSAARSVAETVRHAREGLFGYFGELAKRRRGSPRNDIVSVIANATVRGEPIADFELLSYFALLVVAGNETTRNAASGGLLALIERPDQLARLQRSPGLVNTTVEEIVRWTSPVIQFCRTPWKDVELHGQRIRAGESLCLFYPSANRDEAVYPDPDVFRVDRRPNPHVGFGIGEHFCLGANLARIELRVIFSQLARRLRLVELAGTVERVQSSFLGGVKRMPIRYRLGPG
jgi:cytochrome P450